MDEMLKGNFKVKKQVQPSAPAEKGDGSSLEELMESGALEKLGGSMAFVKKSGFLWKGDKGK